MPSVKLFFFSPRLIDEWTQRSERRSVNRQPEALGCSSHIDWEKAVWWLPWSETPSEQTPFQGSDGQSAVLRRWQWRWALVQLSNWNREAMNNCFSPSARYIYADEKKKGCVHSAYLQRINGISARRGGLSGKGHLKWKDCTLSGDRYTMLGSRRWIFFGLQYCKLLWITLYLYSDSLLSIYRTWINKNMDNIYSYCVRFYEWSI